MKKVFNDNFWIALRKIIYILVFLIIISFLFLARIKILEASASSQAFVDAADFGRADYKYLTDFSKIADKKDFNAIDTILGLDEYYTKEYKYNVSCDLMIFNPKDCRDFYQTDDKEALWRQENEPTLGCSQKKTADIKIITLGNISNEELQYYNDCIASMPEDFIQKMSSDGWTIRIINTNEYNLTSNRSSERGDLTTLGLTDFANKTVSISAGTINVIYHEFGHILANYAKKELKNNNFYSYVHPNIELSNLCCHSADGNIYIYMNSDEQLAESFYDFLWYPTEMQEQAPTLFNIYTDTISSFRTI